MREGRWRNDVQPAAAAGRWPGADRRRAEQIETTTYGDLARGERTYVDGQPHVSTASTAATAYRYGDLDEQDRARFDQLVTTFGLEPEYVHPEFHVGRTRRGYVILLSEYDRDRESGELVHVLGAPVLRHHLQPVDAAELPAACRRDAR